MRRYVLLLLPLLLTACAVVEADPGPYRLYNSHGKSVTLQEMTDDLCGYDVIVMGEWHGDPTLQALQVEIFEGLLQDDSPLTLSLEMYERDQQARLDSLQYGALDFDAFLARPRTWPTLNKQLVKRAIEEHVRILAANVPRRYAARVAREGTDWLHELQQPERRWIADSLHTWEGEYQLRFFATMTGEPELSPDLPPGTREMMHRMYAAQCLKDDTMAMSIVMSMVVSSHSHPRVLHVCGDFHSRAGLGTVERLKQRLPRARVAVITPVAAEDESLSLPAGAEQEGDYLIVLPRPEPAEDMPAAHPMPGME